MRKLKFKTINTMTHDLYDLVHDFMSRDPEEYEIEEFYVHVVSNYTKDSITEILENK